MRQQLGTAVYYRIVKENPPKSECFRSYAELGIEFENTPDNRENATGLSTYATAEQAKFRASKSRYRHGRFIAKIEIDTSDGTVRAKRTCSQEGHHTLWFSPLETQAERALGYVTDVIPVD